MTERAVGVEHETSLSDELCGLPRTASGPRQTQTTVGGKDDLEHLLPPINIGRHGRLRSGCGEGKNAARGERPMTREAQLALGVSMLRENSADHAALQQGVS
jgi:hypothetical protein